MQLGINARNALYFIEQKEKLDTYFYENIHHFFGLYKAEQGHACWKI